MGFAVGPVGVVSDEIGSLDGSPDIRLATHHIPMPEKDVGPADLGQGDLPPQVINRSLEVRHLLPHSAFVAAGGQAYVSALTRR